MIFKGAFDDRRKEPLPGKCQLEVIDIYQNPLYAKDGQIVAAPTLIKELPLSFEEDHRQHE